MEAVAAPKQLLPEPDHPDRLLVRSFLHQSLCGPPQLPSQPPPPPQQPPVGASLATRLGGHRPHPSLCRQFASVRGGPVIVLREEDDLLGWEDDGGSSEVLPAAWSANINTLWRPLDTLTGLEYASVIAAGSQRRRQRQQWHTELAELAAGNCGGDIQEQLRLFATQFGHRDAEPARTGCARVLMLGIAKAPQPWRRPASSWLHTAMTPPTRLPTRPASQSCRHGVVADDKVQCQELQEAAVLCLLCQVLRTEDPANVHTWLSGATEREKALVAEVIRVALDSWWRQQQQQHEQIVRPPATPAGVDRLVIEHSDVDGSVSGRSSAVVRPPTTSASSAGRGRWDTGVIVEPPPLRPFTATARRPESGGGDPPLLPRRRPRPSQLLPRWPPRVPPTRPQLLAGSWKLRYTRADAALNPDVRTGLAWRLRGPAEMWGRLQADL